MKRKATLAAPVIALFVGYCAAGQDVTNAQFTSEAVSNLVLAIRQQPHTEKEYAAKEAAIKQAACIHNPDPQIIEALLDNLLYVPGGPLPLVDMHPPKFSVFPAGDALLMIGQPVVPNLLERLKVTDDVDWRARYLMLLKSKELAGERTAELIKAAISGAPDDQKAHLEKCLKLLQ